MFPSKEISLPLDCSLNFVDDFKFSTETFIATNQPYRDHFGTEVSINPWGHYYLWDLYKSINLHNQSVGKPLQDFYADAPLVHNVLKKTAAQKDYQDLIKKKVVIETPCVFDTATTIDRKVIGQKLKLSGVKKNLLENFDLGWISKNRKKVEDLFNNIDFVFETQVDFVNAETIIEYSPGQATLSCLVNNDDPDLLAPYLMDKELKDLKTDEEYDAAVALKNGTFNEIDYVRRKMQSTLGFNTHSSIQSGLSDVVTNFGLRKRILNKCGIDRIDLSASLLFTLPTSLKRDLNNAGSFAFGKTGITTNFAFSAEIIFKPKYVAGVTMLLSPEHTHQEYRRMPLFGEPANLSPFATNVEVRYGFTSALSGYLFLRDCVKDGLDLRITLSSSSHSKDIIYNVNNDDVLKSSISRDKRLNRSLGQMDFTSIAERNSAWELAYYEIAFNYRLGSIQEREEGTHNLRFSFGGPQSYSSNMIPQKKFSVGYDFKF